MFESRDGTFDIVMISLVSGAGTSFVWSELEQNLEKTVNYSDTTKGQSDGILFEAFEVFVEVAILVWGDDGYGVWQAGLFEYEPLKAVVLPEATRAGTAGHKEGDFVGVAVRGVNNLKHVTGGDDARQAFLAGCKLVTPA